MSITNLHGCSVHMPFYITKRDGLLLFESEIIDQECDPDQKNILLIPSNVRRIPEKIFTLATHSEQLTESDMEVVRAYLHVVPKKFQLSVLPFSSL